MKHRAIAARLRAKMERYARTGAGDVKALAEEDATEICVTRIGPRGAVYED